MSDVPPQFQHVRIHVVCGYDLVARAVHDTLTEAGWQVQIGATLDAVLDIAADLLIVDASVVNDARRILPENTRLIVIDNICTPQHVYQTLGAHIVGYLYLGDRLCGRLKRAVIDVLEGGTYYSPSISAALAEAKHLNARVIPRVNAYHREVLRCMAEHQPAAQIANQLDRTTQAIYQVQSYLRDRFGVQTNGALLARAVAWGIISDTSTS